MLGLQAMGTSQAEMGSVLRGATGHSQGVASAVVVSWAEDDGALLRKSVLVIRYLFWHGLRMQLVYDAALLAFGRRRGGGGWSTTGFAESEGASATPMLAVVGLQPARLQQHISAINAKLGLGPTKAAAAEGRGAGTGAGGGGGDGGRGSGGGDAHRPDAPFPPQ